MEKKAITHWLEKAMIVIVVLVVLVVTGVTLFPRNPSEEGAELASIDDNQVKEYLRNRTGLEITGIGVDLKKSQITAYYRNDDVRDEDEILFDICNDATSVFPILYELTDAQTVKMVQLGMYVDQAGENSLEISAAITLTREKARDIDWKTINATSRVGLIEKATELYINPEVSAQLDNTELLDAIIMQLSTH